VLVNNAGVVKDRGGVLDLDDGTLAETLEVNLFGPLRAARAFIPGMVARGYGSIVNISSIAGSTALGRGNFAYSVTKGGVDAMTRELAVALGRNVGVGVDRDVRERVLRADEEVTSCEVALDRIERDVAVRGLLLDLERSAIDPMDAEPGHPGMEPRLPGVAVDFAEGLEDPDMLRRNRGAAGGQNAREKRREDARSNHGCPPPWMRS